MFILDVLLNILYIVEGYTRWLFNVILHRNSQRTKRRLSICEKCDANQYGICQDCGCIIKAKVRCDFLEDNDGITIDGCPRRKW